MKLSNYLLPILKENPSEAKIKSHQLMLRSGMIRQSSSGIYSWLPLGFKVLKNIEKIIRQEQNKVGAIELLMPTIQSAEIWKESGRFLYDLTLSLNICVINSSLVGPYKRSLSCRSLILNISLP